MKGRAFASRLYKGTRQIPRVETLAMLHQGLAAAAPAHMDAPSYALKTTATACHSSYGIKYQPTVVTDGYI